MGGLPAAVQRLFWPGSPCKLIGSHVFTMISLRNFALRRAQQLLLSGVDLSLHPGWRVGVVGRNGVGKSSLFAAIAGELEADQGDVDLPNKLRIASVAQETPALATPALDFVLEGDEQVAALLAEESQALANEDWEIVAHVHQKMAESSAYDAPARAGRLLHGLGFAAAVHCQPVSAFSGGWRVRLNVARALMMPSDVLLLDEPTNHLDLDAVYWLEQWLLKYPGTLLLISHDREFLDTVATHTLHLHNGRARLYVGGYTDFERQRAEQLRQQQIAFDKEQAERAHLQRFIDRFRAKASKASQAQSRIKRLEKLAGTEAVRAEREFRIHFAPPARLPFSLISLREVQAGYSANCVIVDHVNFNLESGQRIGLLGVNGAGKTTLVKTLVGELPPVSGQREAHPDVRVGYFAQHTLESLHETLSPIDHLRELEPNGTPQVFRDFLGRWNFSANKAFEPVSGFSGGERARLALALLAWQKPNVLLLDEPTNHLDLEMREALAEALADFDGAIVMVSHDRHLLGLVCDSFWRIADAQLAPFAGDLDDYALWLRSRATAQGSPKMPQTAPIKAAPTKKPVNAHKLHTAEQKVMQLEAALAALDTQLSQASVCADTHKTAALARERERVVAQLGQAEAQWLELMDT